jgi:glycine hydroxymethyltransferase
MKETEMKKIAALIHQVISNLGNQTVYCQTEEKVMELCQQFPLYPEKLKEVDV